MITFTDKISPLIDQIIFIIIALLIILSPLPFGSVQSWAVTTIEITIFSLGILWSVKLLMCECPIIKITPLGWSLLFFLGLVLFQIIPIPTEWLKQFSPESAHLYQRAGVDMAGPHSISLYPFATLQEFYKISAYVFFYFIAVNQLNEKFLYKIIYIILAIGLFEAGYGLFQRVTGIATIFKIHNVHAGHGIFGTFINLNHYAAIFEMAIPLGLGLFFFRTNAIAERNKTFKGFILDVFSERNIQVFITTVMVLFLIIALVLSTSKGAILSLSISMAFFFSIIFFIHMRGRQRALGLVVLSVILMTFTWISWEEIIALIPNFERQVWEQSMHGPQSRGDIWLDSLSMASEFTRMGSGLGSYMFLFPTYQFMTVLQQGIFIDHAHNEYLEILCETGLFGFFTLMFGGIVTCLRALRLMNILALGIGAALFSLSLDNFAEFNLRIPSNALLYFLLFALLHHFMGKQNQSIHNT